MDAGTTVQITMPEMGESVTEGTILEWLKAEGDPVEADEGIVEVSTDKVDAEIPAPASGILTKILVGPDETVPTGAVLGEIQVNGRAAQAGDGGAPESAGRDVDFASDESAVEEAEHGAAAETEHQWSAEEPAGNGAGAPSDAPTEAPTERELVDVTLPEIGESVAEGTVLEWLKQVGDDVQLDDGLVEISTDKVDAEVPAPVAGTLAEILVQPDDTVTPGTVLCRIAPRAPARTPPGETGADLEQRERASAEPRPAPAGDGNGAANATPVAVRIAEANGIELSSIEGSGPRGRVTKADVMAALESNGGGAPAPAPAATPRKGAATRPEPLSGEETATPMRGPAATLARFMEQSRSIPTATS